MKKTFPILPALVLLLAGACSKNSGGGGVKLRNDTDSVAYVIGMNVGANLLKMDSTINVNAVCEGIRDMFRGNPRLSAADAETFYLSYVNYALPEKARAYEEQFLLDIAKSNRSYARTSSGVTYTVTDVGDQNQVPTSERDSVALRWVIRTAAGDEITSSYERGDTVRSLVRNLRRGVQESVKLIGKGGKINAWMPSSAAYGAEAEVILRDQSPACLYDDDFVAEVADALKETAGPDKLAPDCGGGGEDFHNYKLARPEIKAAYFGVGVGAAPGLHAPTMHFDDTLLPLGVAVFENVVLRHLG